MSFPGSYFKLFDELTEAKKKKIAVYNNISWQDIPSPPSPTGINLFPTEPEAQIISRKQLPDQIVAENRYGDTITYQEILTEQFLTVIGHYAFIVGGTATKNTPFSQNISITKGSSETKTFSIALEISMGISGGIDLSTTLSTTFERSITIEESETITNNFHIETDNDPVSAVWWQANYVYRLESIRVIKVYGSVISEVPTTETFLNRYPIFIPTTYPISWF